MKGPKFGPSESRTCWRGPVWRAPCWRAPCFGLLLWQAAWQRRWRRSAWPAGGAAACIALLEGRSPFWRSLDTPECVSSCTGDQRDHVYAFEPEPRLSSEVENRNGRCRDEQSPRL